MLTLTSIVAALIAGGLVAWLAHKYDLQSYIGRPNRITAPEFVLGTVATIAVAMIVTMWIGPNLSRNSAINGYKEFYNGSVTQARVVPDRCEKDGSCSHTYVCDTEYIYHPAQYDSNGRQTSAAYTEVIDHHCPYATYELDYVLDDNLGRTITIGDDYFEANPQPWRGGRSIPGDVPREAPARWVTAKQNVKAGMSDPVTGVFKYANFILASESDLYKKYSGSIAKYQKARLLPKHTDKLGDDVLYDYGMQATKLQAVGSLKVDNIPQWNDRLMRLNAALGSDLQGDMHVVLMPASKVSNPDDYITALKAYWTSLGKWSISKNGIILAIGVGTDGKTVEWSRAATGMPQGNGAMLTALSLRLKQTPFEPDTLFGNVPTSVYSNGKKLKVKYDHNSAGLVGKTVLVDFPYKRPCMKCEDAGDAGVGYVELKDLVPVKTGAKIFMFFIVLFLSLGIWWGLLRLDPLGYVITTSNKPKDESFDSSDLYR